MVTSSPPTAARRPAHLRRRELLAPDVLAVIEAGETVTGPPAHELPVAEQRRRHERDAPLLSGPGPAVAAVRDALIPGPHGAVPVRAYAPAPGTALPVVAYFHGGGWTLGSIASFDAVGRALALAPGALVVSVGYRLAPEHPFPVPVDEAEETLRWLAGNARALGGDGKRLAVAGDSAGANLATAAARRLRDAGGPRLRAQALVYPVCDVALDTPSADEFASGYGFGAAAMRHHWELYLDGADGRHPDASPLRARALAGLPPAFVATAAADVLRDEGERYVAALRAAGVRATLRRYAGTTHGFWRWLGRTRVSHRAVGEVGAVLRAALA
jgi:acetyl esterase